MSTTTTGIEWTDATWNPVRGCSRVSDGCRNCYAERVAARFSGPGFPYEGLADPKRSGSKWTGKVRLVESALEEPLRWRKPRRIFVNSMSDLFHEALPGEAISRVFRIMEEASHHTFQVLTKRADRMAHFTRYGRVPPHIWMGVSVEDQKSADERIPYLLETPAAVRFLSCEPLLGPVDLSRWLWADLGERGRPRLGGLHWVIVGGESGPGARPFHLDWARPLVRQCSDAGVPCFVKQLGAVPVMDEEAWRSAPTQKLLSARNHQRAPVGTVPLAMPDSKGGEWDAWPAELRVREFPEATR